MIRYLILFVAVLSVAVSIQVSANTTPPAPHITALAVSPDGRLVAAASSRGWLTLWDLATGRPIRAFKAHDDDINLLRFAAGGSLLLTGAEDYAAKLWSVPALANVRTIVTTGAVTGGDVAVDGTRVVLGLWDGTLGVWDVATGRRQAAIKAHLFGRVTVDMAPSGRWIVTGGSDQTIRLWDFNTLSQVRYFKSGERGIKAHLGVVYGVRFLDDDRMVSSASRGTATLTHLALWDVRTGQQVRSLTGSAAATGIDLAVDNKRIVFANDDRISRQAVIFDLAQWQQTQVLRLPERAMAIALAPGGRLAIIGSLDGRVGFWDTDSGRLLISAWSDFDRAWGVEMAGGHMNELGAAASALAKVLEPYVSGGSR